MELSFWLLIPVCIVSIYLISKGVEIALRGMKPSNPNRANEVALGVLMIVPGVAAAVIVFYWWVPNLTR